MRGPRELPTVPLGDRQLWLPSHWTPRLQIFPARVVLRITDDVNLAPHHAATICAMLKAALQESAPDGLLIDAPEQGRVELEVGEMYQFGLTLLAESPVIAQKRIDQFRQGLMKLGIVKHAARTGFRGNFEVVSIQPSNSQGVEGPDSSLIAISEEEFRREVLLVRNLREVTLRFHSPLHCERPKELRRGRETCLDEKVFPPEVFLRRAARRLNEIGILAAIPEVRPQDVDLESNQLVWLDLEYGPATNRKPLSGAVGRIVLRLRQPDLAEILVRAQYLRVGEKTRFGFGAFRIEELPGSPYQVSRSTGLLPLALRSHRINAAAERHDLPSGKLASLAAQVLAGEYEPEPPERIILPADSPKEKPRLLCVPKVADRAIQECVIKQITPPIDSLLEQSSVAYRKGLGRHTAARRIQTAYRSGYHWAVRSDLHRFFDSVDHAVLRQRLDAYLADDELVDILMTWIDGSSPQPGRGLPTGSPLSPLLSNLFLDRFDEQIEADGALLIRYADDFLILFQRAEDADRLLRSAQLHAESLKLHLNTDKTRFIDLREPFEFLGFRFERTQEWEVVDGQAPRHVDDLGWTEVSKPEPPTPDTFSLPGETRSAASEASSTIIAGPGIQTVSAERGTLILRSRDPAAHEHRFPLWKAEDIVILGRPTIEGSFVGLPPDQSPTLWLADDSGRLQSVMSRESPSGNANTLTVQILAAQDPARTLAIARHIVVAKLMNYADTADRLPTRSSRSPVGQELRQLAIRVPTASTVDELRGLEGAGAAAWYRSMQPRLAPRFKFPRRVAPGADDPVNALLNLGFTWLYRLTQLLILRQGLAPAVGFLHAARSGHDSLASDLMEPFRHLVERTVIHATYTLKPGDFREDNHGPYALSISPPAAKKFLSLWQTTLTMGCVGTGQTESRSYRLQLAGTVRSLHRHLLSHTTEFRPFQHSPAPAGASS